MSDRIEDDLVAIRGRLDYPNNPWREAFPYHKALEALDRLASDAHRCERLRAALDKLKQQQRSNQNRAEVAERGHKACLAREQEHLTEIKRLRATLGEADDE